MATEIKITLRDPLNNELLPLSIEIFDVPLAKKWIASLTNALNDKLALEKNYAFMGFPESYRNLEYLCQQMLFFRNQILDYRDEGVWQNGYKIEEYISPGRFYSDCVINQDLLNIFHKHFEILFGQVWQLSRYYLEAPKRIRYAIRQINHLVHEIENYAKVDHFLHINYHDFQFRMINISFLKSRSHEFEVNDFDNYTLDPKTGMVVLHYGQTGKNHLEAFVSRDEHCGEENLNGSRYFNASFDIYFGPNFDQYDFWRKEKAEFREWMIRKGYDPDDKSLAVGHCAIGQLDLNPFKATRLPLICDQIKNFVDIYKIQILESGRVIAENVYDLKAMDPDYHRYMIEFEWDQDHESWT